MIKANTIKDEKRTFYFDKMPADKTEKRVQPDK